MLGLRLDLTADYVTLSEYSFEGPFLLEGQPAMAVAGKHSGQGQLEFLRPQHSVTINAVAGAVRREDGSVTFALDGYVARDAGGQVVLYGQLLAPRSSIEKPAYLMELRRGP